MTAYVTAGDITDAVLKGRVTDGQIDAANQYVDRLAAINGVDSPAITPYTRQLAVAVACRECCLSLVGTDPTVHLENGHTDDVFERKYKLYANLVAELTDGVTVADFLSDEDKESEDGKKSWTRVISISRS